MTSTTTLEGNLRTIALKCDVESQRLRSINCEQLTVYSESSLFSISPRGDASSHDGNEGEDLLEPDYVGVVADVRGELEVPVDGDQGVVLGLGKLLSVEGAPQGGET